MKKYYIALVENPEGDYLTVTTDHMAYINLTTALNEDEVERYLLFLALEKGLPIYSTEADEERTIDTGMKLVEGVECYHNEWMGTWYEHRDGMIKHAYDNGYSEEELWGALDIDSMDEDKGYMYFTTYTK